MCNKVIRAKVSKLSGSSISVRGGALESVGLDLEATYSSSCRLAWMPPHWMAVTGGTSSLLLNCSNLPPPPNHLA